MNKSEVLTTLAEELNLTKKETEHLYNSFVEILTRLLSTDKGFTLPGFGSFKTEKRPSRTAYNPHYQKEVVIPEKKLVRFNLSSTFKNELNGRK